jgi:hypothetical protein
MPDLEMQLRLRQPRVALALAVAQPMETEGCQTQHFSFDIFYLRFNTKNKQSSTSSVQRQTSNEK